jgi:hypothetical protein
MQRHDTWVWQKETRQAFHVRTLTKCARALKMMTLARVGINRGLEGRYQVGGDEIGQRRTSAQPRSIMQTAGIGGQRVVSRLWLCICPSWSSTHHAKLRKSEYNGK